MRNELSLLAGLLVLPFGLMQSAYAAEGDTAYVVSYFETMSPAKDKAAGLLRQLAKQSRQETGNYRFEILQRIGQPDEFVILETWRNNDAQSTHGAAGHTRQFREKLQPLLRGPYDERPHTALAVGSMGSEAAGSARAAAIYAVTHVDVIPKARDVGVALVKQLAEDGRGDKGNVRFEGLTQDSRTNHMTVVEIWADRKALEAHGMAAHKKAFREKLTPLSGSLYDERLYKVLD
jgi:quinol monooxygenase YgiN